MNARIVCIAQLPGIQAEKNVDLVSGPFLGLVDFVVFQKSLGKVTYCGKTRIFINDGRIECHPGMLIEPAADHLAVLGPLVVGVQRRVDTDETLAIVLDERHHVCLLAVVEVQFARRADEDQSVEVVEILRISFEDLFL